MKPPCKEERTSIYHGVMHDYHGVMHEYHGEMHEYQVVLRELCMKEERSGNR